ncbi:hypothetical protein GTO89_13430 [Heliobacterium gestii]|uniref:Uncharacterized protein n=1 Tax=Heliomicrobium gestii TaxID=2699 RepID=A0A845LHY6_HELGE|nr:hypothetical protein [Heliomicrobium gestii]MBM7867641.1 hypothetical protein [Heliomicrobium gestii]MZP44035.1 hypothetical protein [Heliomicrobium gestii]
MALETTSTPVNDLCPIHPRLSSHCLSLEACDHCDPRQCVSGLIRRLSEQAKFDRCHNRVKQASQGGTQSVSRRDAVGLLALFLARCSHCGNEHKEECELNLARLGLEYALTSHGDLFAYQGNPVLFLLNLRKTDPALADEVTREYDRIRSQWDRPAPVKP